MLVHIRSVDRAGLHTIQLRAKHSTELLGRTISRQDDEGRKDPSITSSPGSWTAGLRSPVERPTVTPRACGDLAGMSHSHRAKYLAGGLDQLPTGRRPADAMSRRVGRRRHLLRSFGWASRAVVFARAGLALRPPVPIRPLVRGRSARELHDRGTRRGHQRGSRSVPGRVGAIRRHAGCRRTCPGITTDAPFGWALDLDMRLDPDERREVVDGGIRT
jgi:hypothetical protein